jgi:multicomponent Na+:H+ antiporter subunit D
MAETTLLLWPAWPLLLGALLVAVLPRRTGGAVLLVAPLVALAQVGALRAADGGVTLAYDFYGLELLLLRADTLSIAFGIVFAAAAFLAGLYGLTSMDTSERATALATAGAGLGVVFAGDLITLLVFWEIKAVVTTVLILGRRTPESRRAAQRYFFVHFAGGSVLLGGIVWHTVTTGSTAFEAFASTGAAWTILVGVALSAAIPPMHTWLPDAYPQAGVAGMVFLSAFTTKSAVYALVRGFAGFEVLLWVGVIMALYGVTYAMLQDDIRRLLAYHIVSQVGFMVAGVGVGTAAAVNGAVAHAFAHILYKGLLLMGAGALLYATGRSLGSQLGGLARRLPWVLVLYMVGAVSISSVPLFSGFVSKELTIHGVSDEGLTAALWLLKVASVGTFLSTALKLPYAAWFGPDRHQQATGRPTRLRRIPTTMYVAMGLAAAVNLAIGVYPALLWELLPHANDYTPFTSYKLSETLQLLLLTALGFWLLIAGLGAKPGLNLDLDWFHRVAPWRLQRATRSLWPRSTAPEPAVATASPTFSERIPALVGRVPVVGPVLAGANRPAGAPPPASPTWVLGVVIFGVSVVVLGLSLAS